MINMQGHHVPMELVAPVDLMRDDLVQGVVVRAKKLRKELADFKHTTFGDIAAFLELSFERYKVKRGGKKGNLTLFSYDGLYKIIVQVSENIHFDERLQAAKALIDECITSWTSGSNDHVKVIIHKAFEGNKAGSISTGRILSLRSLEINDSKWQDAMKAIADSITVANSKSYIRLYERDDEGQYQPISLDLATV